MTSEILMYRTVKISVAVLHPFSDVSCKHVGHSEANGLKVRKQLPVIAVVVCFKLKAFH